MPQYAQPFSASPGVTTNASGKEVVEDFVNGLQTRDVEVAGYGYVRQALSTSTPYALAPPNRSGKAAAVTSAVISIETQNARYTMDGTTPTTGTNGHPLPSGSTMTITMADLTKLALIADVAGAIAHITFLSPV